MTQIRIDELSQAEIERFILQTTLGKHQLVAVVYGAQRPCLVLTREKLIAHLERLIIVAPVCYFVGITASDSGDFTYVYSDFVEFKQSESLYLSGFKLCE
jgi:hypothetical protein